MTKKLIIACTALLWSAALIAQSISVVAPDGTTKLYQTLTKAIEGATGGSVIYLPGGGFPINDSVKITKKLTIIGIGHKIKTENPDGYTTIGGNLFFNQGSDGSALMGCYVTGTVHIGNDAKVDDVLIRCNNINHVWVGNGSMGTNVNQNYLREGANFTGTSGRVTNNVTKYVRDMDDGFISNNIITDYSGYESYVRAAIFLCDRTSITNNIIFSDNIGREGSSSYYRYIHTGSNCFASGNMCMVNWGDDCINLGGEGFSWSNVFENWNGISATSNFKFKEEYKQYEGKVGIYGGTKFSDDQLAPVPYIVGKDIPEQTDAAGQLHVKIRVKAGE